MNMLLLPVLGESGGCSLTSALFTTCSHLGGPLPRRRRTLPSAHARVMGPGRGIPPSGRPRPSEPGPPTHQGLSKICQRSGCRWSRYAYPGGGQEAAKFMLIAEVEEDALARGQRV